MIKKPFFYALCFSAITLCGCSNFTRQDAGTVIGAGAGGVIGSAVTGGSAAGTIVGAAAGAVVGNQVARKSN